MSTIREYATKCFAEKEYPNLGDPKVAQELADGIAKFKEQYLEKMFPWELIMIGLDKYGTVDVRSYNTCDPNMPDTIVGSFPRFSADALRVIVRYNVPSIRDAGRRFFLTTPWQVRVELLRTISKVARERFWLHCAAKMYETGQSIAEAIGETEEECDFPIANAMYLEEHNSELLIESPKFAGDISGKRYVPHGVFLNVGPFNFPGAIPMDMATKAIAMGNAFIEKSSPKSSLCGFMTWETIKIAFERMGLNWRGVVNYAPGDAEVVDAFLASPHIAGMSFTGSSKVLNDIKERHGNLLRYGWAGRAKLVTGSAETSGINTFIVCADADPVHAAQEYVKSFVGRSGQKCSSARIAFIASQIYEQFVEATKQSLGELRYGDVKDGADLGAMITAADRDKLTEQIAYLINTGVIQKLCEKPIKKGPGHDFPPTVFKFAGSGGSGGDMSSVSCLMNTELFGPVSVVMPFMSIDEVESMCAASDFALTGSVWSKDAEVLRRVLNFIPAGNVYWNRKCTGALVETECFGGLRSASSPSGVKGKGSLLHFGSQVTLSGPYPKGISDSEKHAVQEMLVAEGFGLSKS